MKYFCILLLFTISVCGQAQESFVINGKLPDNAYDGKTIYLKDIDNSFQYITLDSTVVKNKAFTLKGTSDDMPRLGFVLFEKPLNDQKAPSAMIILEKGKIELDMHTPYKVKGTPGNDELQVFYEKQNNIIEQLYALQTADESDPRYQKLYGELKQSSYEYVKKNIQNRAGEFILLDISKILDKEQVLELLSQTRSEFAKSKIARQLRQSVTLRQLSIGDDYMDIQLTNIDGSKSAISDYIGKHKYVLLDFWASWCGPCIKEMPNLVKAYEQFKDKGFEIVGISLDERDSSWKQAVKRLNMTWAQMSDLGGWESDAAQLYNVKSIPFTLLLDEKGKVVAKNLWGNSLIVKLEQLLK